MQECPLCGFHKTEQRPVVDDESDEDPPPVMGSVLYCHVCARIVEENLHE